MSFILPLEIALLAVGAGNVFFLRSLLPLLSFPILLPLFLLLLNLLLLVRSRSLERALRGIAVLFCRFTDCVAIVIAGIIKNIFAIVRFSSVVFFVVVLFVDFFVLVVILILHLLISVTTNSSISHLALGHFALIGA